LSTAAKTHAPGKKTGMPSSEPESAPRPAPKPAGKRIRRPAEEARRLILDAAEVRLAAQGPEGIRLQDIARDVGISHPAILHHFESREGLVRALIARTSKQLREKLLAALEGKNGDTLEANELIENVFEALSDRGTARLLSWMMLTGRRIEGTASRAMMVDIATELHALRTAEAAAAGHPAPAREDTLFMAMLTTSAAFGDAIIGRQLAEEAGLDQEGITRFRRWLAKLLNDHAAASGDDPQPE